MHDDVVIGEPARIGDGADVLPGGVIGRNAVVGAGPGVTRDAAACEVVAGVPAGSLETRWLRRCSAT